VLTLSTKELNTRFTPALRQQYGITGDDVFLACRDTALQYGVKISLHNRTKRKPSREVLTVKAMVQPQTAKERSHMIATIRVTLEHVLKIFRAAGEDLDKCTLPPFAKLRGRCDEEAMFVQIRNRIPRLVKTDGEEVYPRESPPAAGSSAAAKQGPVGRCAAEHRGGVKLTPRTAGSPAADLDADERAAVITVYNIGDSRSITMYTIDEETPIGPNSEPEHDGFLEVFENLLTVFTPTVTFIAGKKTDVRMLVTGGHADVVFDVSGLAENVESSTGIGAR
jgi:hypothetical protein